MLVNYVTESIQQKKPCLTYFGNMIICLLRLIHATVDSFTKKDELALQIQNDNFSAVDISGQKNRKHIGDCLIEQEGQLN